MKHLRLFLMSMVAAILVSCGTTKTVPITGRQQSLMVSDDQVLSLSFQEYSDYMKTAKPSTNSTNTAMGKASMTIPGLLMISPSRWFGNIPTKVLYFVTRS